MANEQLRHGAESLIATYRILPPLEPMGQVAEALNPTLRQSRPAGL